MLKADYELQSIAEVQKEIFDGKTTVKAVVEKHLKAIEQLDPQLNAMTAVNKNALQDAEKLDVSLPFESRRPMAVEVEAEQKWRHPSYISTQLIVFTADPAR